MRIRRSVDTFLLGYWIIPAILVGMLWILVWMSWQGLCTYSDLFRTSGDGGVSSLAEDAPFYHLVEEDVTVGAYFTYMKELARKYDQLLFYPIDEYAIVHANPWLIDSLANTDYYLRKEKGEFVYDQRSLIALHRGELLQIPDSARVCALQDAFGHTELDLNIPACRLRIKVYEETISEMPVRVGRNERKYLAMAGARVDLRTRPGEGKIIRLDRDPVYINPADNRRYYQTRRDDGRYTLLPRIPWLEPEINGRRYGQWIHPTTNAETLGWPYSNGCIGTSEAGAWRLYYYAPVGTKITIRYDLTEQAPDGMEVIYPDIYGWRSEA